MDSIGIVIDSFFYAATETVKYMVEFTSVSFSTAALDVDGWLAGGRVKLLLLISLPALPK